MDLIIRLGDIDKLFGCIKASGSTVCFAGFDPAPGEKFVGVCFNLGEDHSLLLKCRRIILRVFKPLSVCGRPTLFFHKNAQSDKSSLVLAPKRRIVGTYFHKTNPPNVQSSGTAAEKDVKMKV
jgi:hypothetical protein